jgi:type IV secretion system protein TrbC
LQTILDSVKDALTGTIGRTLAIIGVAMVGLAWVFGQMDIRRAGTVVVGIAIIFGAAEIVAAMAG